MSKVEAYDRLRELVFDEGKVVTYKTLSRELNIHVNLSKRYLTEFLNENQATSCHLSAYYLLIGEQESLKNSQVVRVIVVPSEKLQETEANFKCLISSHIYSIQRGLLADKSVLYTTDYNQTQHAEDHIKYYAIKNSNVKILQRQINKANASTSKASVKTNQDSKSVGQKTQPLKTLSVKTKSPDIFAMIAKKPEKKTETKDSSIEENAQKSNSVSDEALQTEEKNKENKFENTCKKNVPRDKNSVKYLFSKQSEKAASKPPPVQNIVETKKTEEPIGKKTKSPKTDTNSKSKRSKSSRKNTKAKNVSESDDEEFKPKRKKHKRIIAVQSDSDSDNEEMEDQKQCSVFKTISAEESMSIEDDSDIIPPTPPVIQTNKKQWKTVTKTFEDEDGFFVTKTVKEYISESSDNEEVKKPEPVPITPMKKPVEKDAPAIKKKQASLTSFFKKN